MTIPSIHTVVKSRPASSRFGAGVLPYTVPAVMANGYVPPSDEDAAWAAANMNGESEPDYDRLAGEAAAIDAASDLTGPLDFCRHCGELSEVNRYGLCDVCDDITTNAGDSRY